VYVPHKYRETANQKKQYNKQYNVGSGKFTSQIHSANHNNTHGTEHIIRLGILFVVRAMRSIHTKNNKATKHIILTRMNKYNSIAYGEVYL